MCTKISGVPSPRVRNPKPRRRLNHFTTARSSPLVGVTETWVRAGGSVDIGSIGSGDAELGRIGGGVEVGSIGSGDIDIDGVRGDLVVRSTNAGGYLGTGLLAYGSSAGDAVTCASESGTCALPGGTTAYTLLEGLREDAVPLRPQRPRRRWLRVLGEGGDDPAASLAAAALRVDPAFVARVYDALSPGATLVVTDERLRPAAPLTVLEGDGNPPVEPH